MPTSSATGSSDGVGPHEADRAAPGECPLGAFWRVDAHAQAVLADDFGAVPEGHAPGDDPPIDPFPVFLDQREDVWSLVSDELANLLG